MKQKEFLNQIKLLRKRSKISQDKMASLLYISTRQYQRLESGQSQLSVDMLVTMSEILKTDLLKIYDLSINSNKQIYLDLKSELFAIMDKIDRDLAKNFIYNINIIIDNNNDIDFLSKLSQLKYLANGCLYIWDNDYSDSLDIFTKSLKLTVPNYSIDNLENLTLNNIEQRILLAIAFSYHGLKKFKEYETILFYVNDNIDYSQKLFIQVKYNLGMYYIYTDRYNESINLANNMIDVLESKNDLNNIFRFYYILGVSYFSLNDEKYNYYFNKTLELLEIYNLDGLYDRYKKLVDYYLYCYEKKDNC